MAETPTAAVYGLPPRELAEIPAGAVQVSPLKPGAKDLETLSNLTELIVYAPPGALERRQVLAAGLRALAPGGRLLALAPKDKGGSRLGKELAAFGCDVDETARRHHRICAALRPAAPAGLEKALTEGAPRLVPSTGLWSQPGVFSWDRIDPGSVLLAAHLPPLAGDGADLGCGIGVLAHAVLASPKVTALTLVDIDRRAVEAARRNVDDPRADFHWADALEDPPLAGLDFVVMNPPFHDAGHEDRGLGQAFIRRAAKILRPGGRLYAVANRHLPYEAGLKAAFKAVHTVIEQSGYKVFEAIR